MELLKELREQAQKAALRAGPKLFKVFIIYILIQAALNFVCYLLQEPMREWVSTCYQYYAAGDYQFPDLPRRAETGYLLAALILLFSQVLSAGWISVTLQGARGNAYSWHDLAGSFPCFWKIFVISVLRTIGSSLGLLCFVIPGIILFYNWRLSFYILAEHPEYGPVQCMKQSRRLMTGERKNLFKLDLSCWLLYGLAILVQYVTSGILQLWQMPSLQIMYTVFYNKMVYWKAPDDSSSAPPAEDCNV